MLTAFKGAVQWLAIKQCCPMVTTIHFRSLSSSQTNPAPIKHKLPIPPHPTHAVCDLSNPLSASMNLPVLGTS